VASVRLIELGAILIGMATLARVAARFGFSPIPLYILGGLAFGEGGILPLDVSEEFIEVGADIGLVLLLLMLGLQYTAKELSETLRRSARPGVVNVVLNFTPGFVVGLVLHWDVLPSVLLGGISLVSSSGIASKLLEDFGWTGNRETPAVLSILVLEDLAMALYLPVVSALAFGGAPASTVLAVAAAVASVGLVLVIALRYERQISRILFSHSDESLILGILGVALSVAGLLEGVRASAAVGAFLVGIALSGPAADRARPLLEPLRDLFAAVFFLFFGLQVDPAGFPRVLGAAVILAVVTGLTKFLSAYWSARDVGVGPSGRIRAGAILLARGEFSVAIAALGVGAGLEPDLLPLAAAYVLILAVAGPITVRVVHAHRWIPRPASL
jgi:monovalent cation:H+ antiporter-2, CPA2 family